mmetsp:Transcript_10942/g.34771  ORF Transcript_10942/g.34771 Transcript_10942/m.34771 type:complete len:190 (+) Transcript_10942:95-664(+)
MILPEAEEPAVQRKKEIKVRAELDEWNYLKGAGPSAPQAESRDPNPKSFGNCDDKVRFKPFWCNKRPEAVIQPYQQRLDCKATQEVKAQEINDKRHISLMQLNEYNGFNPMNQADYKPENDKRRPESLKVHGVPHPKQSPEVVVTATVVAERAPALAGVKEMRKERIRTEGLMVSRPEGQRMSDIMKWG